MNINSNFPILKTLRKTFTYALLNSKKRAKFIKFNKKIILLRISMKFFRNLSKIIIFTFYY